MTNHCELSASDLQKKLACAEIRKLGSISKKIFEIKKNNVVSPHVAIGSGIISKGSWYRGVNAQKNNREVGINGRPSIITDSMIETIENKTLVMLSEGKVVRVKDIYKMMKDYYEENSKEKTKIKFPCISAAYYLIDHNKILKSALSKPMERSKMLAQSPDGIRKWFDRFKNVLDTFNIGENGIFNFDETSLRCGESSCKLCVCLRNQIPPSHPIPNKTTNSTLCVCVCADGSSLPSFLLYSSRKLPVEFRTLTSFNIRFISSSSGWINSSIFETIMISHWIPSIKTKMKLLNMPKAVFLLDNHPSHINEKVEKCADKQGIIMMRFPPNLTHLLQPCDSSIFARFKKTFNDNFNPPQPHSSSSFRSELAKVLPEALTSSTSPSTIKSAFQKTGIWPVMAAPVLSRVSGSPISQRTEEKSNWDSELYGKYSPTNKRIKTRTSHMDRSNMKPVESEETSVSNFQDRKDDSIPVKMRTKKVKQYRNQLRKLLSNINEPNEKSMNYEKSSNKYELRERKVKKKRLLISYDDDANFAKNFSTI